MTLEVFPPTHPGCLHVFTGVAVNRKKGEQALGNSAVYAGCAACGGWRQPTGGFGMQSGVAICMWFWTAVFRVTGRYNVSSGYIFVDAV